MTKPFLSSNIQNLAGTRTLTLPKEPWRRVYSNLFTRIRVIVLSVSSLPALLSLPFFGVSEIFFYLMIPTLFLTHFAVRKLRGRAKQEITRYHKARENELLGEEELQALNLCARFTYRDQGWYHTYENFPFWDRKAGYDDPAFSETRPYITLKFDYSEHLARSLKQSWGITSKKGALTMIHDLRDGKLHRCSIVNMFNQEGFDIVYDILSSLTGVPHDSFHQVFFPDEDQPHAAETQGQSLVAALDQFGLDEAVFLAAIRDKCEEFEDPQSLKLHGDARDQMFQIVRHVGRLALRNDLRNMFLFKAEAIDQVLYPQGEDDLLALGWGFDLSRGMFLLRNAYAAGFLSREELRSELPAYRQVASAVFPDWQSYFCSEVIGYLSWKMRDSKPADAYSETSGAADECHKVMAQHFPIGRQLPWPEADAAAKEALAQALAGNDVNPFFMPQTLGAAVAPPPLAEISQPEGALLH
ncbi:DUF1266 domain-containing protein [Shimia sp. R9_3]|uniref:DUF1266 domain-containing protein n=1 Tax=Shimia sp. R9_3 TaxID=2821113 RepID=UPI001ADA363B|nr:DUF1266 domain-containing protein [Shimia sp. R9_3]MBO9401189.1 DUF1266 domain-containing protein [Shimia sp. R9_3]